MAAVIGSTGIYNRDPLKMGRFYASAGYNSPVIPIANTLYKPSSSNFHTTHYFTSVSAAASSANAAKQLYTVSGKGGFLVLAFSSYPNATSQSVIVTYVITVDGVATTINLGASGAGGYLQGWLGTPTAVIRGGDIGNFSRVGTDNNTGTAYLDHLGELGQNSAPSSLATGTVNYNAGNNSQWGNLFLPNLNQPTRNPQTCIRFETSLTVTVAVNYTNNANTNNKMGGVLVRLDS